MKKFFVILLFATLLIGFSCRKSETSNNQIKNSNEIDFCSVLANPEIYKSKFIRLKGQIYGYHEIIFYNENCCETDKILMLDEIGNVNRKKIIEKEIELDLKKQSADFYGNAVITGKLENNDLFTALGEKSKARFKFTVLSIEDYNPIIQKFTDSCVWDKVSKEIEVK